ncbi:hypothetical protein MSAN_01856700 [Mycena sanguinolenta]|uniref:Uncharacterized protein n=1 Tax=Mycena sanguinolenta TaxID=230812 RepID=A0A8H6XTR7_9AGAR|nr:hypothetical protein MSAN_01856700 [Mycena sanguinolenta]
MSGSPPHSGTLVGPSTHLPRSPLRAHGPALQPFGLGLYVSVARLDRLLKAAPAGAAVVPPNASAIQTVNTEELVNTTKEAIAEAVAVVTATQTSDSGIDVDELSILSIAFWMRPCGQLPTQPLPPLRLPQWAEISPTSAHMPPMEWYVPVTAV